MPGNPDPSDALKTLQAGVLAREYDLHTLLPRRLFEARNTVIDVEADGDEYGLLDIYREQVRMLEEFSGRPIPQDPQAQIESCGGSKPMAARGSATSSMWKASPMPGDTPWRMGSAMPT